MTEQEMNNKIKQLPEAAKEDAYYKLYFQAVAAEEAMLADIDNGSPTARTDTIDIVLGDKRYSIGCWMADVVGSVFEMLHSIKEIAVEELQHHMN